MSKSGHHASDRNSPGNKAVALGPKCRFRVQTSFNLCGPGLPVGLTTCLQESALSKIWPNLSMSGVLSEHPQQADQVQIKGLPPTLAPISHTTTNLISTRGSISTLAHIWQAALTVNGRRAYTKLDIPHTPAKHVCPMHPHRTETCGR